MALLSPLASFKLSLAKLGVAGMIDLFLRKFQRANRRRAMLREMQSSLVAVLKPRSAIAQLPSSDTAQILAAAGKMVLDQNNYFTFPYKTRNLFRNWNYDPLENKYWPKRHYSEKKLHDKDTPKDAKIIWEINRFKDLPTLAQAAAVSKDVKYAKEVQSRMESWIAENPVGLTINWASALEISIRLIAWMASLEILRASGFDLQKNPNIQRSIFEHIRYLQGDLSIDKVVPTNHLIGEAAGLFVASALYEFPNSEKYRIETQSILQKEIVRQTHEDGATREASSWYHSFVTDLFDLADRTAAATGNEFSTTFHNRLAKMKAYREALTMNGGIVRYGDADDGWAVFFAGDLADWKTLAFGPEATPAAKSSGYFATAKHIAAHAMRGFLFLRAGEFGMGGPGFSSHAHNDLLSPIIYLEGIPVLVDPGTYVYNGDRRNRAKYRGADAHNGLNMRDGAKQRMNFGWQKARPSAKILETDISEIRAFVRAQYAEWQDHVRSVEVSANTARITDTFSKPAGQPAAWRLHISPEWTFAKSEENLVYFRREGWDLKIALQGKFESPKIESYDYSPSYLVRQQAPLVRLDCSNPAGEFGIALTVIRR